MRKILCLVDQKRLRIWLSLITIILFNFSILHPVLAAEHPLTLSQCLQIAFKNNLTLAQTKELGKKAHFDLKQAKARLYPELDLGASASYISGLYKIDTGDIPVDITGLPPATIPSQKLALSKHENGNLSVSLIKPLYTGGRIMGGIKASEAALKGSDFQMALDKSIVRNQVITAFYQLAKFMEYKRISEASYKQIVSHLKDAQNLVGQGMMLKSDLLPVDIRKLDTELMIVKAGNSIDKGKALLAERMGLPPETNIEIIANNKNLPPWPIPKRLLADLPQRPEQLIAQEQINMAQAKIDIAGSGLLPQINFSVSGHYGWPGFIATDSKWTTWWQTGINMSWDIFDMGRERNQRNAAMAEKERLKIKKVSIDHQVDLDRINAQLAYEEAYRNLLITKQKVISAKENFKTKEDNFKVGMATNTDYLDAHIELLKAQSEMAMVSAEVQIDWANFLKAIGKGDQFGNLQRR